MAALSASRNTPEWSGSRRQHYGLIGVAASTNIYVGGMVCINTSGFAVPGTASGSTLKCLGICDAVYAGGDLPPGVNALNQTGNGSLYAGASGVLGAAGAISVKVVRGVFGMDQDGTVTIATVGSLVYCADDHTVSTSTNTAAAPVAGTVIAIDGGLVYVDFFQQFALAAA